jgi:N-acetylneuraminate synthase
VKSIRFVAEVSSNHSRDLQRCLAFIDTAADLGCAAVKFQLFRVRKLFAPEILGRSEKHRQREAWELPVEFLPVLHARCHESGLQFACTPFYLRAVDELLPYVDFYKISSYELLWDDLLTACARTGKGIVLSTGMATLDEVQHAVALLKGAGCKDLTLLHCISVYPAPIDECNLSAIHLLRNNCDCPVGWSDHSVNPGIIYRAVYRWGATMVEFHLDLDGLGDEYKAGHCWLPDQIRPVIRTVCDGFAADGNGEKRPTPGELNERDWRADPSDGLRPLWKTREGWR